MAKIEFTLGEISGRMGGVVFSKNAGGNYIKNFTRQNNPATPQQARSRNSLVNFCTQWAILSENQRNAWRALSLEIYDRFGNARFLSGRNLFISLNSNLHAIGESLIADAPIDTTPPPAPIGTITIDTTAEILDPAWFGCREIAFFNTHPDATTNRFIVSMSAPLPTTIHAIKKNLKWIRYLNTSQNEEYFSADYYPVFGEWLKESVDGKRAVHISLQTVHRTNGRTSPIISAKCIYNTVTTLFTP